MKLNDKRRKSLTAKRTIKIFIDSLCGLMMEKPFEKITVSDICEQAMIPRATFYNYFEDKYDLLDTYCQEFVKKPGIEPPQAVSKDFTMDAMSKILNVVDAEHVFLQRVVELNEHGIVFQQMKIAMEHEVAHLYEEGSFPEMPFPRELDAQLTASMLIAICQWWLENFDDYNISDVMGFFASMMHVIRQA